MTMLKPGAMLGLALRFEVTIDDMPLGGWSQCDGLSVEFTFKEWKEGGTNGYTPLLPERIAYSDVKLTRAVTAEDSARVMRWLALKAREFKPGTGEIRLYDARQTPKAPQPPVASWTLRNVYPRKWDGPKLDARSSEVATEVLVLRHEGFLD